ncbi:tRNA-dihydrouridine synthase, partial [bacterium]|nr:tRNA-dihydrouridine synthase [bacterium]
MKREINELENLITELKEKTRLMLSVFSELYGLDFQRIAKLNSLNNFSEIRLNPFKISNLMINNPVIAAPMAGISDNTYRIFAKYLGCSLTFSEMATSYGLIYNHEKSLELAKPTDFERPCAVQLFGNNPEIIAEAASLIEANSDMIDINMGCPVPKVLKTGSGGYLLNEPETIGRIVNKLKGKIKKPVTVKLRIGWDEGNINILDIARIVEYEGADAITIHGRTVKQGYSGKADYEYIKKVKNHIKIPVIASGDIESVSKAKWVSDYTACDGMMIGRTARGNPWIFSELLFGLLSLSENDYFRAIDCLNKNTKYMDTDIKKSNFPISNSTKVDFLILYLKFMIYFKDEEKSVKEFRKILGWAFKGIRDISEIRN